MNHVISRRSFRNRTGSIEREDLPSSDSWNLLIKFMLFCGTRIPTRSIFIRNIREHRVKIVVDTLWILLPVLYIL